MSWSSSDLLVLGKLRGSFLLINLILIFFTLNVGSFYLLIFLMGYSINFCNDYCFLDDKIMRLSLFLQFPKIFKNEDLPCFLVSLFFEDIWVV